MDYGHERSEHQEYRNDFQWLIKLASHDVIIWLALIFFAPLGIGLLWWAKKYTGRARAIITICFSMFYVGLFVASVLNGPKNHSYGNDTSGVDKIFEKSASASPKKTSLASVRKQIVDSKYQKAVKCARFQLWAAKMALKKQNDFGALKINQKAIKCAFEAVSLKPAASEGKNLVQEAKSQKQEIKEKTTPTKKQLAAYRAFWGHYNAVHDSKNRRAILRLSTPRGEKALVRRIARKLHISVKAVDAALLEVDLFKRQAGEHLKKTIKEELKVLHSRVLEIHYAASQDGLVIKLRALVGWSTSTMKKAIQRDLIRAVGIAFGASSTMAKVSVWIVASMQGGGVYKVAQVEVTRQQYEALGTGFFKNAQASRARRLNPRYGPSLR